MNEARHEKWLEASVFDQDDFEECKMAPLGNDNSNLWQIDEDFSVGFDISRFFTCLIRK